VEIKIAHHADISMSNFLYDETIKKTGDQKTILKRSLSASYGYRKFVDLCQEPLKNMTILVVGYLL
jgi:hypothetical protein